METKHQYIFALVWSLVIGLGVASFTLCVAAEFKKTQRKDLRIDGKLCYLPASRSLGLGIGALVSLLLAQIIGSLLICTKIHCSGEGRGISCSCKPLKPIVARTLLFLSWISFGSAVIVLGVATSMSREQSFGTGWLEGECYIVKDGVYIGSAILILLALASTLRLAVTTRKKGRGCRPNQAAEAKYPCKWNDEKLTLGSL